MNNALDNLSAPAKRHFAAKVNQRLDRRAFKVLGVLNELGNTERAQLILNKMGIQEGSIDQAMKVYNHIK